jgi:predicted Rossmann-fold nucleotide-binding protein
METGNQMKAIVCGGRDFSDSVYLEYSLKICVKWWNLDLIITGGAKGADTLAHNWAARAGLSTKIMYADWDTHGKAAGMIRNKLMLQELPDVVIAFKGGAGTENMINISRQANVPVFIL